MSVCVAELLDGNATSEQERTQDVCAIWSTFDIPGQYAWNSYTSCYQEKLSAL